MPNKWGVLPPDDPIFSKGFIFVFKNGPKEPVWATEEEAAEEFQSELDAEWEEWWNALSIEDDND